jgi:hypothetical protein
MWDAEKDDDAAFERRLDTVVREIGERGKLLAPEAVPPPTSRNHATEVTILHTECALNHHDCWQKLRSDTGHCQQQRCAARRSRY